MENKKYELLPAKNMLIDTKGTYRMMHRIRALKDICISVSVGDLGGYIESEKNLSHYGKCWVFDNAMVYDNAKISDDATIRAYSRMFGNTTAYGACGISGWAEVHGNASIWGNAVVNKNSVVSGHANIHGSAVITDDAQVYGLSSVGGLANVRGQSEVCGNVSLYGQVIVFGNARVDGFFSLNEKYGIGGHALITERNHVFGALNVGTEYGNLTVYKQEDGSLGCTRGCFIGTVDEFITKSKRVHDERVHTEYKLLIDVAKSRILGE